MRQDELERTVRKRTVELAQLVESMVNALPPLARKLVSEAVQLPGPDSALLAEGFDLAQALEGVDGRYDRLQKMVEFHFSEAPLLLTQMRAGLQSQDASAIARAAHRLAGTLVYLRAQPALAAARRVDDLGVAGDLQGAAAAIAALEHELALLERALIPHRAPTQRRE